MIEWDSRMRDNHSVQILKTVIPFFDVAVGERIDLEGLLSAVRPFAAGSEYAADAAAFWGYDRRWTGRGSFLTCYV